MDKAGTAAGRNVVKTAAAKLKPAANSGHGKQRVRRGASQGWARAFPPGQINAATPTGWMA